MRTQIRPKESSAFCLTGPFTADPPPEKKIEAVFNNLTVETHSGAVTWTACRLNLHPGSIPPRSRLRARSMPSCAIPSLSATQGFPLYGGV